MAEKRSSNTSNKKRTSSTARSTSSRKTAGSRSRSGSARSSARTSASRTSTSSRNYGRTSNYAARKRHEEERSEMQRDILLVLLFAGMVFLFLSNYNLFGIVGHYCKMIMFGAVGAAAYVLPIVVFALILYGMMSGDDDDAGARISCVIVMYLVIAIVCDLMSGDVNAQDSLSLAGIYARCTENSNGGGVIGGVMAWLLLHSLGMVGTVLVLIVIAVICLVVITGKPLLRLMQDQAVDARDRARYRREAEAQYRAEHPEEYDEGFLPDEDEDDLTDDDIAEYRARQEEIARARREERAERLRDEARRDVERRHETRNQVYKTFRGIVGDTNLSNDPYVRQMTEEAAAREAAVYEPDEEMESAPEDAAYNDMPMQESVEPVLDQEIPAAEEIAPAQEPISEDITPASKTDAPTTAESAPADRATDPHTVRSWWQAHAGAHKETTAPAETTQETATIPEIAEGAYAAQQLLKNQRPGTDGIRLTVAAAAVTEPMDDEGLTMDADAVRASVRQAIPIHRESNNLHEINVMEFQGSYAALARDTIQTDEDDEDLTSRIIREGMAELEAAEDPEEFPYGTRAQNAALDAFSRSTAFTEIQDAYRRPAGDAGVQPQTAEISDVAVDAAAVEVHVPATYVEDPATQADDRMQTAQEETVPATPTDAWDVVDTDSMDQETEYPEDEASVTDDIAEPLEETVDVGMVDAAAPCRELSGEDVDVPAVVPAMHDDAGSGRSSVQTAAPAREMTTPVGSGSPLAAQHAQNAQIHTEAKAAAQNPAAAPAQTAAPQTRETAPAKKRPYVYPPLSLLQPGNPSRDSGSDEELRHTAEVLETTLHTFGVNCKITDISQGPAVTRYELLPEQGVKVSKVVGLSDDIKLALAAMDIRIEAPIPGKSAIGIEVPNKVTSTVALRDILSNPNFRDHKSKLAIGIGKDISGQIVVSDLAKMPHVLIAGSTGSGKSVCINTIIMSILYHASPEEVKLLMIDPKVVELSVYNGIPHLLYPVVTNPQQASTLLNWAVAEMEARYRKFADARVRDMKGYNQMVQQHLDRGETADEEGNTYRVMPRIVVIVDELADLMMVAKNDVETAICRLAQLARAAGIHLIIATQRPSVDVITGLIKANMPSRIAFAVSSGVDSRTILDMNGAEKLLGKGDMLFFPQGLPKPARIQGAFVDDDEVSEVVNFIKEQDPVDTEEEARMRQQMENLASGGQTSGGDSKAQDSANDIDDYFYRAGKFIIEKDNASIGLLQRGFRIGFNRAARLMDQLCDAGVVAESEGTKSRRILMTEAEFEAYCQENDLR